MEENDNDNYDNQTIVIDIGSEIMKAGFAGKKKLNL
jgi:actin-related protein